MSVSRLGNNLAPQSGTVYRAMALKREVGLPYTQYVHVFALFGWLTTVLNMLLATVLIIAVMPGLKVAGIPAGFVTGGLFGIVALGPFVAEKTLATFDLTGGWPERIYSAVHGVFRAMTQHGRDAGLLGMVVFFAVLRFALWVALYKLLFLGMDVQIGLAELGLFLAIYQISALLIITPGNIGVREVVYGVVGGAVGITAAQGVMLSALLRAVQYAVVFPLGLAFGGWRLVAGGAGNEIDQTEENNEVDQAGTANDRTNR